MLGFVALFGGLAFGAGLAFVHSRAHAQQPPAPPAGFQTLQQLSDAERAQRGEPQEPPWVEEAYRAIGEGRAQSPCPGTHSGMVVPTPAPEGFIGVATVRFNTQTCQFERLPDELVPLNTLMPRNGLRLMPPRLPPARPFDPNNPPPTPANRGTRPLPPGMQPPPLPAPFPPSWTPQPRN